MKLIHLEGMASALDQIAVLVDNAALTEQHQMGRLVERDLFFKLIACHPTVTALALDGEVSFVVTHTDTHRGPLSRDISLLDMGRRKGGTLVRIAFLHEEFPFYLQSTHRTKCFY